MPRLALLVTCCLLAAGPAMAKRSKSPALSPTPPAGLSQTTTSAHTNAGSSTLPFTGLDLGRLAVIGVALLAGGLALRWIARRA